MIEPIQKNKNKILQFTDPEFFASMIIFKTRIFN